MDVCERRNSMLIQFKYRNHKCFYEEAVLDMTATLEKRHSDFLIEKNGNKILPFVAIYGANAAGKTTVIDAFFSMAYLVVKSFDLDSSKSLRILPFIFNEEYASEDSEFEIFLNIKDTEYRYGFVANKNEINEEWLYERPFKASSSAKEKLLFERKKNNVSADSKFKEAKENKTFLNDKTLLLSILGRRNIGVAKDIYKWFLCTMYSEEHIYLEDYVIELLNGNNDLKKLVVKFMQEIDPCLKDLTIIKKKNLNRQDNYEIYCKHNDAKNIKKSYQMPFSDESNGTKKAIILITNIIAVLSTGGILFVDELDTQLHPLLYRKIVLMFTNKEINKTNAQLVYTSHSTYLLNSNAARRDQIYLVDKDKNGLSQLYSLADFDKLRGDADYEKKYLSGMFGAIPFQD